MRLCDVTSRAVKELDLLSPFGQDNPRPVFATTRVELAEPPAKDGRGRATFVAARAAAQHDAPRDRLRPGRLGRADRRNSVARSRSASPPASIAFAAHESVELQLIDWQPDASAQPAESAEPIGVESRFEQHTGARAANCAKTLEQRGITDLRVLDAIEETRRDLFVPEALQYAAYDDTALPIGEGQTISQPYIVALMTQELQLDGRRNRARDRHRQRLPGGDPRPAVRARVVTIERIERLSRAARRVLAELGVSNVEFSGRRRHARKSRAWTL